VLGAEMVRLSDPTISFSSILVIAAVAFLAPILVNLAPRLRLPAVALEIVIGIVVGPSGLGWLELDLPVTVLSLMGLAFLLFLAGLEIDPARLRGRVGTISLAFGVSLVLAVGAAFALQSVEEIRNPLFVAIVLASTSLGLIVPVVRDAGEINSEFGQVILASASLAEFGTILLVSLFFSTSSSGSSGSGSKAVLLVGFAVLVVLIGLAMVEAGRSLRVSSTLRALEDTSAQLGVRIAILLLVGFVALAGELGIETILGAFIAGALLRVVDPEAHLTHAHPHVFREQRGALRRRRADPLPRPPRPHPAVPGRDARRPGGARGSLPALVPEPAGRRRGVPAGDVAHVRRGRRPPRPRAERVRRGVGRVARRRRPPLRHPLPAARALAARRQ
jgi:NhaP-type Na+/H+ or K+/H+ antiporter